MNIILPKKNNKCSKVIVYMECYDYHTNVVEKDKSLNSYSIDNCPFCGGIAKLVDKHGGGQDHSHVHFVRCEKCGNESKKITAYLLSDKEAKEQAINIWNKRT